MATKPQEDEPLELTDELKPDPVEERETEEQAEGGAPEVNDEDETVVSFEGDEEEQADDSSTIRQMREKLREKDRELAEYRKAAQQKQKIEVGEKPTMASCDYDEERFDIEYDAWKERVAAAKEQERQQEETNREVQESWQRDLQSFEAKKAALPEDDIAEAQETIESSLSLVHQAVIVKAADDPALFMLALAKSPAKLAEFSKIKDPVKAAAAVARMEGAIKVMKRSPRPAIDKPQTGSAPISIDPNKELEKLQKEADRTGNRTKLIAYKKKLREKSA